MSSVVCLWSGSARSRLSPPRKRTLNDFFTSPSPRPQKRPATVTATVSCAMDNSGLDAIKRISAMDYMQMTAVSFFVDHLLRYRLSYNMLEYPGAAKRKKNRVKLVWAEIVEATWMLT